MFENGPAGSPSGCMHSTEGMLNVMGGLDGWLGFEDQETVVCDCEFGLYGRMNKIIVFDLFFFFR